MGNDTTVGILILESLWVVNRHGTESGWTPQQCRDMPGVVNNPDGTCCAGHSHAFLNPANKTEQDAKSAGKDGCAGGGTSMAPTRSLERESRVDNHDK